MTKSFESSENLKVQFTDEFIKDCDYKGDKHWIILAFQQLQQLPNIRQYLKDRLIQDNMEFHKKTTRQQIEVESIADLARLLFLIMVNCEFVPVNYLIMLAVIMSQQPRMEYPESKASLFNAYDLDLLLESGAMRIQSSILNTGSHAIQQSRSNNFIKSLTEDNTDKEKINSSENTNTYPDQKDPFHT